MARGHRPPRAILKTEGTVFPNTDRPRPANNMFIFFSCGKLVYKWIRLRNCVIEAAYVSAVYKPFVKKSSQRVTKILDTKTCIKEQIHF